MKVVDKVAWIYLREHKVLSTRSRGKTVWYLPGGKREPGESDLQTLSREVREELSVEIDVQSVKYFGTFEAQAHGHTEGTIVRMSCYCADCLGELTPMAEIDAMEWLSYVDRFRSSSVDQIIFDGLFSRGLLK